MSSEDMLARLRQTKTDADKAQAERIAKHNADQQISMDMRAEAVDRWKAFEGILTDAIGQINEAEDLGIQLVIQKTPQQFGVGSAYQLLATERVGRDAASTIFTMNGDYAFMYSVGQPMIGKFKPGNPQSTQGRLEDVSTIV